MRQSGILLHPSSLPSDYGIGTLGKASFNFIDLLADAGQTIWQVLPLGPTGYGDSPYQCFSAFAGNTMLIDIDELLNLNLLMKEDLDSIPSFEEGKVDYGAVINYKIPVLRKAFDRFFEISDETGISSYRSFCEENSEWLDDFSLFMSLKAGFRGRPWFDWPEKLMKGDEDELNRYRKKMSVEIEFQKFIQHIFFMQWSAIKDYANSKGISIIGDIPLYVAYDSSDSWRNPELFLFNDDFQPIEVAGVPPDYFSETGQLWGNPIYNWEYMEQDGFRWWIERIKSNLNLYDIIRIDHFRGLAAYWSVPFSEETAMNGKWIDAPGRKMLDALRAAMGNLPLIAEDLGVITPDVEALRDDFDLPGMKVLQFSFDWNPTNVHLTYNYPENCLVYTGTHDNDTILGWYDSLPGENKKLICDYLGIAGESAVVCNALIRLALSSTAKLAVIPIQDILLLGSEGRMNIPGTTGGNWQWRLKNTDLHEGTFNLLKDLSKIYGRNTKNNSD